MKLKMTQNRHLNGFSVRANSISKIRANTIWQWLRILLIEAVARFCLYVLFFCFSCFRSSTGSTVMECVSRCRYTTC